MTVARICCRLAGGLVLIGSITNSVLVADVTYAGDIKPIFQEHCYACHAGDHPKSGFRLDTGASAIAGGERGAAIVPGQSQQSLLIAALRGAHAQVPPMPWRRTPLRADQIALIAAWIDQGAVVPENEKPDTYIHWSFIVPERPPVPVVEREWPRANAIDRFVQARLVFTELSPSPRADAAVLFRRMHLDVTGIPPSPEAIESFLNDRSPNAIGKVVDRLLHTPYFGERWGRHWLDVARYADSNGYSIDGPRSIWRYREYVIDALNTNLPFDRFVTEQLAGDLIPGAGLRELIATGFHRNTQINQEGGIDREQFRIEAVVDRVATTGTALMGLTIACAQCHDHKFDPISQEEYFRFFALFNNQDEPTVSVPTPEETGARERHRREVEDLNRALEKTEAEVRSVVAGERSLSPCELEGIDAQHRAWLAKAPAERSEEETSKLIALFQQRDPDWTKLKERQRQLQRDAPRMTTTMVLRERQEPRKTHVHIKGDFTRKGKLVNPGVPTVMNPPADTSDRLDLAQWLTSPANPVTARVIVNRIWQQYFGRGLVETENDFGTQGTPPTHPELLDWLAVEFMDNHWNVKYLHRLILNSHTYQQSSRFDPELHGQDPGNRLLARQSRLRLESEIVRDVALAVSGLLVDRIGGPSVHPPQPEGVMKLGQVQRKWVSDRGANRYRRGMYTFFWRATPHPALSVFDSPDAFSACSRRIRSNTPLQALTLLNDPAFHEMAYALATRIAGLDTEDVRDRVEQAFRIVLGRTPSPEVTARLAATLEAIDLAPGDESAPQSRWQVLSRILLNLDETITRE